jgi:hypothetical protein
VVRKAEALLERPKEAWLQRVDRHLAAGSWDKTWAGMNRLMAEILDGPAAERPAALPTYATTPAE